MRIIFILALVALAACQQKAQRQPAANEAINAAQVGSVKGVDRSHAGQAAPISTFINLDGAAVSLKDYSRRPVLLNLWASWCAPCVKELPTLDRLQQANEKGGKLAVVAVSQDSGPYASVVAFLGGHKIKLEPYQDSKMALSGELGPDTVLPTSILYDAQGKEVWRYVGDRDWTDAESAKLLAEASAPTGG